jgi:hypothetical protein
LSESEEREMPPRPRAVLRFLRLVKLALRCMPRHLHMLMYAGMSTHITVRYGRLFASSHGMTAFHTNLAAELPADSGTRLTHGIIARLPTLASQPTATNQALRLEERLGEVMHITDEHLLFCDGSMLNMQELGGFVGRY